jgi:hypothetical protein
MKVLEPFVGTIAASGVKTAIVAVPTNQPGEATGLLLAPEWADLQTRLSVAFGTVSGTNGVSMSAQLSNDGGITYGSAIPDSAFTVAGVTNSTQVGAGYVIQSQIPGSDITVHPTHIKFTITNLDATNAVQASLELEFDTFGDN